MKDKDFSDDAKKQAKSEIEWFVNTSIYLLDDDFSYISDENIGHDLWLSRNGHGAGFFDRDYTEEEEKVFMMLSKILGEIYIDVELQSIPSYDNKLCFFSGSNKYKEFNVKKYKEEEELKNTMKKYNV